MHSWNKTASRSELKSELLRRSVPMSCGRWLITACRLLYSKADVMDHRTMYLHGPVYGLTQLFQADDRACLLILHAYIMAQLIGIPV